MAGFGTGLVEGVQAGGGIINALQAPEKMAMERRKLALEATQTDTAQRAVAVQEGQFKLNQEDEKAQYNKSLANAPTKASLLFTQVIKNIPQTAPLLKPLLEQIDNGQIKTRADLRETLMQAHATGQLSTTRQSLREEAAKLAAKGDNQKAQGLMALYEKTSDSEFENFVDDIMGKPASLRRSASDKGENIKPPVTGEDPYWDARTQSWLQRKSDGTVIKVAQAASSGKGRRIWDADGNLIYEEGGDGLTKKTTGELETKVVDTGDEIVRLESIVNKLDTSFLTVGGKAEATLLDIKSKFGKGDNLNENEKKYITDFTTFAQDTVENLNLYIKRITGAQMSEAEASRLKLAMPDLGKTWFTGDGPDKFKAKAQNALDKAKAANYRYNYYLSRGLDVNTVNKMVKAGTLDPLTKFEPPKPGEIRDGYKYIGGDPSTPDAWEKAN